ncbi:hypothetical protein Dgeo_3071 (plasmid) [Deinococcus geothermalis DSM 11300]|uniref:Uncharacterized protein n=1 Tax=Deinococcus geothermalis (strain DSM 11300 / CIP 105573 / AG-3a) TaxID=319795 RepID=A8ZRK3_DEIGD|nr:hypothetical protein [Deinococcus geothermalis]ABW35112.1 hypothetical protein Dgeo_3071 [Deinococcus geothermalis DSM 11300]
MSDKSNPFKGLAAPVNPELEAAVKPAPRKEKVILDGDVPVQLSVRVRKRVRRKLREDAEAAGLSIQAYLERLILQSDGEQEQA